MEYKPNSGVYEYRRYMRDGSVKVIGAVVRTKKKKKKDTKSV